MSDRIVVLRSDDPLSFVADACGALAEAVNEPHAWSGADVDLIASYASLVRAYAAVLRRRIDHDVKLAVIDHLLERLGQAERGEFPIPVADIVDRLHAELVSAPVAT